MQLLFNARIYTMDERAPFVEALLIDGGCILAAGKSSDFQGIDHHNLQTVDLGGKAVLPGLIDAHIHLEYYALGLQKVDCETATKAECLKRVAERIRSQPPGAWVLGHGWNQNNWRDGFGSAAELDAVSPANPVYLTAKSLHAGWANSAAMRLADVTASTPDPPDGRFGRDNDGSPDGLLFESAMEVIANAVPEPTITQVSDAIHSAQFSLAAMGLTGVHDFDRRRSFLALQELHELRKLKLRVIKSIPLEDLPHAVGLGLRGGFGDHWLRIGQVKLFADGALGPHTAAMFQPYEDDPGNRGMLFLDAEEILEHGHVAAENGLALAVHAIGDRANHEVLDAFERLRAHEAEHFPGKASFLRHRIEHVQVLHPGDMKRLADMNVIASMQPIHATSDMEMADRFWGDRAALSYAWQAQLNAGAVLAFGSDAPVESPNPFWGIHAAVTRRRVDGSPGLAGWRPEQRISLNNALKAYTSGAAYAAGLENVQGMLAPGFLADLIVLKDDPFTQPVEALRDIKPQAVMVGGEWILQ